MNLKGDWSTLHNENSVTYFSPNIIMVTEPRRVKWALHIPRIREARIVYNNFSSRKAPLSLASHCGGPGSRPESGISGGQNGVGVGFPRLFRLPLPIFIPQNSPSSQSPEGRYNGPEVADVPSGPSMDSTPPLCEFLFREPER
jgi:hypothetical protein